MQQQTVITTRPLLRTKGFSTLHIDIFEMILRGKTNREINKMLGYTRRSHAVVDHSKQVMRKLLAMEALCIREFSQQITYPRDYVFWWERLLDKHREVLIKKAITPMFYLERDN